MKNNKITTKLSKPRDPHFVALTKRKQGAHGKTTKALRKGSKQTLVSAFKKGWDTNVDSF